MARGAGGRGFGEGPWVGKIEGRVGEDFNNNKFVFYLKKNHIYIYINICLTIYLNSNIFKIYRIFLFSYYEPVSASQNDVYGRTLPNFRFIFECKTFSYWNL